MKRIAIVVWSVTLILTGVWFGIFRAYSQGGSISIDIQESDFDKRVNETGIFARAVKEIYYGNEKETKRFLSGVVDRYARTLGDRIIEASSNSYRSYGERAKELLSFNLEEMRMNVCQNNLTQLAMGVKLYQMDNNGTLPPDLRVLFDRVSYIRPDSIWMLHCPSDNRREDIQSYDYVPKEEAVITCRHHEGKILEMYGLSFKTIERK